MEALMSDNPAQRRATSNSITVSSINLNKRQRRGPEGRLLDLSSTGVDLAMGLVGERSGTGAGELRGPKELVDVVMVQETAWVEEDKHEEELRQYRVLRPEARCMQKQSGEKQKESGGVGMLVRKKLFRTHVVDVVRVPWRDWDGRDDELGDDGEGGREIAEENGVRGEAPGDCIMALRVELRGAVDGLRVAVAPTLLVAVYFRPNWKRTCDAGTPNETTLRALLLLLEEHRDCDVVLGGDFNIKPQEMESGSRKAQAMRAIKEQGLVVANGSERDVTPEGRHNTRLGGKGQRDSVLDYFLVSGEQAQPQEEEVARGEAEWLQLRPSSRLLWFMVGPYESALSDHAVLVMRWYMGCHHSEARAAAAGEGEEGEVVQAGEREAPLLHVVPLEPKWAPEFPGQEPPRGTEAKLQEELEKQDAQWVLETLGLVPWSERVCRGGEGQLSVPAGCARRSWQEAQVQEKVDALADILMMCLNAAWLASARRAGVGPRRRAERMALSGPLEEAQQKDAEWRRLRKVEQKLSVQLWELRSGGRQSRRQRKKKFTTLKKLQVVEEKMRRRTALLGTEVVTQATKGFEVNGYDRRSCRSAWALINRLRRPVVVDRLDPRAPTVEQHMQFQRQLGEGAVREAEESPEAGRLQQKRREVQEGLQKDMEERGQFPELVEEISEEEMEKAMEKLKDWKAPGADGVTGYLLKHGRVVRGWLTELFRVCFAGGVVPTAWKEGLVVTIAKRGGDVSKPEDYRPVTLESVLAKYYELVLNARLQRWAENNGRLHDSQYGFRPGRGTQDALQHLVWTVDCRRCVAQGAGWRKRRTWVAFLDIRKAYDTVQHPVLLAMLRKVGVVGKMWRAIHALYQGASRRIRAQGVLSQQWEVVAGVMQGSVLSPLLFALYINELAVKLEEECVGGVEVSNRRTYVCLYADDIAMMAETAEELARMVERGEEVLGRLFLRFSPEKSKVMVFHGKDPRDDGEFQDEYSEARRRGWWPKIEGQELEEVTRFRYLGLELSGWGDGGPLLAGEASRQQQQKQVMGWQQRAVEERVRATERAARAVLASVFGSKLRLGWVTLHRVVFPLVLATAGYGGQVLWWKKQPLKKCEVARRTMMAGLLGLRARSCMVPEELMEGELGMRTMADYLDQMKLRAAAGALGRDPDGSYLGFLVRELLIEHAEARHPFAQVPWRKGMKETLARRGLTLDEAREGWLREEMERLCGGMARLEVRLKERMDPVGCAVAPERRAAMRKEAEQELWCSRGSVRATVEESSRRRWRSRLQELQEGAAGVSLGAKMSEDYWLLRREESTPQERREERGPAPSAAVVLSFLSRDPKVRKVAVELRIGCLPLLSVETVRQERLQQKRVREEGKMWVEPFGEKDPFQVADGVGRCCLFCGALGRPGVLEDVEHVLVSCPLYEDLRRRVVLEELKLALRRSYYWRLGKEDLAEVNRRFRLLEWEEEVERRQGLPGPVRGLDPGVVVEPAGGFKCGSWWSGVEDGPAGGEDKSVGHHIHALIKRMWQQREVEPEWLARLLLAGEEHPMLRVWNEVWWERKEEKRRAQCRAAGVTFRPRRRPMKAVVLEVVARQLGMVAMERRQRALREWRQALGAARLATLDAARLVEEQRQWAAVQVLGRFAPRMNRVGRVRGGHRGGVQQRQGVG